MRSSPACCRWPSTCCASHREAGDRVIVATGAPPELARAILAFAGHGDLPVIGTRLGPKYGSIVAVRHCHYRMKMRMLADAGYGGPVEAAYTDSSADLPLLHAARKPVVVNPKHSRVEMFRKRAACRHPDPQLGMPGAGWGSALSPKRGQVHFPRSEPDPVSGVMNRSWKDQFF